VADLAARGRTNREIAAELFVSHRTVEDNLTRIYRKIGVRSRAELARRFSSVDGSRPSASSLEDHR
jgi:DNA-binding NarL/FixJ family response regulator